MEVLSLSERVQENLAMAQSLGLVTIERNANSGQTEVRMHMRRHNKLPSSLILGSNIEDAIQFLSNPNNQVVRETFENALGQANLQKFQQLASACFRSGAAPSERELQLLERFRQKYAISEQQANSILSHLMNNDAQPSSEKTVETAPTVLSQPIRSQPLWVKVGVAVLVVGFGAMFLLSNLPSTPKGVVSLPKLELKTKTAQIKSLKLLAGGRSATPHPKPKVKRLFVATQSPKLIVPQAKKSFGTPRLLTPTYSKLASQKVEKDRPPLNIPVPKQEAPLSKEQTALSPSHD
jgi:hypothetical protein